MESLDEDFKKLLEKTSVRTSLKISARNALEISEEIPQKISQGKIALLISCWAKKI